MSLIETRGHQLFPVLDAGQIETAKRFASGPAANFPPGELVFGVGQRNVPAWLVLRGSIEVMRRDGLNREAAIISHGPGQFSGEVNQLAGRESLAYGRAGAQGCTAFPFDAAHVRALIIGSA
jgi:thioredoxin reductase (NADPH)